MYRKLAGALGILVILAITGLLGYFYGAAPEPLTPPKTLQEYVWRERLGAYFYPADSPGVAVVGIDSSTTLYSAMDVAHRILGAMNQQHLSESAKTIRFVIRGELMDRLGNTQRSPVIAFEFDVKEMQSANLKNLGVLNMADLAKDVIVFEPSFVREVVYFCKDHSGRFCELAAISVVHFGDEVLRGL
jgi:hypothetical protein